MATKMENRVGVNFAIFRSNPWCQFIVLLEICYKDTNIHEKVENKISDFWLRKAQNVRDCHIFGASTWTFTFVTRLCSVFTIGKSPRACSKYSH